MSDTIVMIHGMWGSSWCWDNYKSFFGDKGYRCVTPALRYHDMSPTDLPDPRLGKVSLLDYAQDLENEIVKLEQKPIIMGHSMGGLLAQMLSSRGLAKAAVLLTPLPPRGIANLAPSVMRMSFCRQGLDAMNSKPFKFPFSKISYALLNLIPEDERKKLYGQFVFESGHVAMETNPIFNRSLASYVDETKVKVPVLIIGAGQDRATPASIVRKLIKKYSRVCTYKEFEGHAHWILGEPGWQYVAGYIDEWIKLKI